LYKTTAFDNDLIPNSEVHTTAHDDSSTTHKQNIDGKLIGLVLGPQTVTALGKAK